MPRRRFPWKAIAAGSAVLGALGALVAASRERPATGPRRIALIGDSYAVGLGPELAKIVPNFRYEGHVGTNTRQWADSAPACGDCGRWLADFHPTIVLVSLGVNDGAAPNPKNYGAIVGTIHGTGARVVWVEPPASVKTAARSVIASLGVPTVPATTTPLSGDKLHPLSYRTWAAEAAKVATNA